MAGSTFGSIFRVTTWGESHGKALCVTIDGCPAGIALSEEDIQAELDRRKPGSNPYGTKRKESDSAMILSGVFEGKTTGTPLCAIIRNENTRSQDYERTRHLARPSHADYTGYLRYQGFADYRGGGHFSGRLTAPLVFAGALAKLCLARQGVTIGGHILRIGSETDTPFDPVTVSPALLEEVAARDFAVVDPAAGERMKELIQKARMEQTSVGGIIQCAILGMPGGAGAPDQDSVEGVIARHVFGVPAVKGLEFGLGFGFGTAYGHEVNDSMRMENGRVVTDTNHNGGILGGITNGMPILFQAAVKPTPSISRPQQTVDLSTMEDATLEIHGRHDPCILTRATVVLEAAAALAALEVLS